MIPLLGVAGMLVAVAVVARLWRVGERAHARLAAPEVVAADTGAAAQLRARAGAVAAAGLAVLELLRVPHEFLHVDGRVMDLALRIAGVTFFAGGVPWAGLTAVQFWRRWRRPPELPSGGDRPLPPGAGAPPPPPPPA